MTCYSDRRVSVFPCTKIRRKANRLSTIYFLEHLVEIIETAFFTASVRNEVPLSLILIGPSGVAKSKLLTRYQSQYIHPTDSVTSQGLFEVLSSDKDKKLKFILLPDFNPTLNRRPQTVQSTVSNLLSVTHDGTVRVDDGRQQKICEHPPIGLITAATDDIYNQQAKRWFALGLRRRIIPLFYCYNGLTVDRLQNLVSSDQIHSGAMTRVPVVLPKTGCPQIAEPLARQLKDKSQIFAGYLGKLSHFDGKIRKWQVREVVPISPHVTLRTLARARALKHKRGSVNQEDVNFLDVFLRFCDPERPCAL